MCEHEKQKTICHALITYGFQFNKSGSFIEHKKNFSSTPFSSFFTPIQALKPIETSSRLAFFFSLQYIPEPRSCRQA